MYQVFVSHKTEEISFLEGLVTALSRQRGMAVYIAERCPWPGVYLYDQKIIPAIAASDCVLVLLTPTSAASPDINQEIGIARTYQKPMVALVEKGMELRGVLNGREVIFFDRSTPLPALQTAYQHLVNQATWKEQQVQQQRQNAAWIIAGLALMCILGKSGRHDST